MTRVLLGAVVVVLFAAFILADDKKPEKKGPMIGHMVYFKLKDGSPEARKKFVESCNKYLADHEGTVFYSAGPIGDDFKREVNVRDWDVALHLVFVNKAAHDKYQDHPDHVKFVAENKASFDTVRVFDSELAKVKTGK